MADEIQRVAIAVVEDRGRYLVGTRMPGEVLAGYAEFPGGKCRPDEAASTSAIRECREETGLDVIAVRRLFACRHTYPHGRLDIEFWLCRPICSSQAALPIKRGYQWLPAQSLKPLRFPEANRGVIELLCAETDSAG
jgi:8-oxo-dGTP diphosphatase